MQFTLSECTGRDVYPLFVEWPQVLLITRRTTPIIRGSTPTQCISQSIITNERLAFIIDTGLATGKVGVLHQRQHTTVNFRDHAGESPSLPISSRVTLFNLF